MPLCAEVAFAPAPAQRRSRRTRRSRSLESVGAPLDIGPPLDIVPSHEMEDLPERLDVLELQRRLAEMGLYRGSIDGFYDPPTKTAIHALFLNQSVKKFELWPQERTITAARQLFCRIDGIDVGDIDGLPGPQTEHAFEIYEARQANGGKPDPKVEDWRDEPPPAPPAPKPASPAPKPAPSAGAPKWPRQGEVEGFFGAPGANQTSLELPFKMRIAWDPSKTVTRIQCHTKVRKHMERIWVRTLQHYGLAEIKRLRLDMYGGCLNVRRMRGGTAWSMHAFGIAWDVDPERNALKMRRDRATLDAPEYEAFWGFVYDEGAISLGRERNFDWMHFQFARF
jgi:peptidoglycan hydrolase-like protein with peptidoglycan-binding domain